jgi:hypothetical protein
LQLCGPGIPGPLFYWGDEGLGADRGEIKIKSGNQNQIKSKVKSDGQECPSYTGNVEIRGSGNGSGLHIAAEFFGELFHFFQLFVEVFGQEAFAQLLQIGVQGHAQG